MIETAGTPSSWVGVTQIACCTSRGPTGTLHDTASSPGRSRSTRHRDRRWARTSSQVAIYRRYASFLAGSRKDRSATTLSSTIMSFLDDYLPAMPSISEVGELVAPGLPDMELPDLAMPDFLPSIAEGGELAVPRLPSLPDMPSMAEVGELALPSLPDVSDIPIAEVGELVLPDMSRPHTPEELAALRERGAEEAERGLTREDSGNNVVGQAGDDSIIGEDGPLFPYLFGDNPEMQRFGRLHDVEAAMAEADNPGWGFTAANMLTAGVGGVGTLVSGDADTGAAMADSVFRRLGYETGDYATVQSDVASHHRPH